MPATASSARRAEAALGARGVGVEDYLAHIGASGVGPPSVEALAELQARHLERVVFENLEIQRGRPTTVDYAESAERIVGRGRGGYCLHLNGAFGLLLEALGYEVSRRRGTVQPPPGTAPRRVLNHLVVLVHGLPTSANPEGTWWAEVGFGDGSTRPLALRVGTRAGPSSHLRARALGRLRGRLAHEAGGGRRGRRRRHRRRHAGAARGRVGSRPRVAVDLARVGLRAHRDLPAPRCPRRRRPARAHAPARGARRDADDAARRRGRVVRGAGRRLRPAAARRRRRRAPRALWQRVCAQHEAWAASDRG